MAPDSQHSLKVVYIAGPYRAATEHEVAANIALAARAALHVWDLGAVALCPHKNSAWFGGRVPDRRFIEGGCELLKRCDAVLLVEGWMRSKGATEERIAACQNGVPVFETTAELAAFLTKAAARPLGGAERATA